MYNYIMKNIVCVIWLLVFGAVNFVSADDFSDDDRTAILRLDEYIHASIDPEASLDYLESIVEKNDNNIRVQHILWEVISHFRPNEDRDDSDKSANDESDSFESTLQQLAASINKSHNYESTLSLDALELKTIDDEYDDTSDVSIEQNQVIVEDDTFWIEVDYSDPWPKEEVDGKFIDPDYQESREELDYEAQDTKGDIDTVEEESEISEELKSSVEREEISDIEEQRWATQDRLVTEFAFDEDKVEQYWLRRVNDLRIERWLTPMTTDYRLRETARDRSLSLRAKREADHKRSPDAPYYDYPVITQRFAQRGIVFELRNGATSTENIWRARHTCSDVSNDGDCTDEVIADIRRIFNYFAAEEADNGVHRRTMIQPNFHVVWVSFAIDAEDDKVYAVMHYGTKIIE